MSGRPAALRCGLPLLVLALIGPACSTIHGGAESDSMSDVPVAEGVLLSQRDDSLEVVDSELSLSGLSADVIGETMTAVEVGEAVTTEPRRQRQRAGAGKSRSSRAATPLKLDVTAIRGPRSECRAVAGVGTKLSAGVKLDDIGVVGYLRYRGNGIVRLLHVGNLSLSVGERLLLGRRLGTYPPPTVTPVRGSVALSPSLSRWFGRPGAALALGLLRFRGQAVLVAGPGPNFEPRAAWLSLTRVGETASLGITFGREIRAAPSAPALIPYVAAVHGAFVTGAVLTSVEYVGYPKGRPFFAVRATHRRRPTLSLLLFRAPTFPSGANPITNPVPNDRTVSGAGLIARHAHWGARTQLSFLLGAVASPAERRSYRRILAAVSAGDRRHISWETSLYWLSESSREYPKDAVDIGGNGRRREGRLRLGLRVVPGSGVAYRVHLDYLPGLQGRRSGALLSISTSLTVRGLDLQWRVSAYSLAPGRRGYITRPGAGFFESFSTVSGRGSDVSARLRWRPRERFGIFAYYGTPWSKVSRAYVGAEFHLGR